MDSDIHTTFYFFIKTHISVFLLENLYLLYIIQIEYQVTNVHC